MQKILIFGGSFNPPHKGHTELVRLAADAVSADKILIIPAKKPPHKPNAILAPDDMRLEMCRIAAVADSRMEVSDIEIRREGLSYTYTTLTDIKRNFPDSKLYLFIGGDMLEIFPSWYRYEEIIKTAVIVTVQRPGTNPEKTKPVCGHIKKNGRLICVPARLFNISSTAVRDGIRRGADMTGLVDSGVLSFIYKNKLYR